VAPQPPSAAAEATHLQVGKPEVPISVPPVTTPAQPLSPPMAQPATPIAMPQPETVHRATAPETRTPAGSEPVSPDVHHLDAQRPVRKAMSITDLMNADDAGEEGSEEDDLTEPEGQHLAPLDLLVVQELIEQYAQEISDVSPGFSTALLGKPVSLGEGNRILISFSNKIIADPDHLKKLLAYLRTRITHTWFRIEPVVEEVQQQARLILSPREKYTRMVADHPGVELFAKKLGLEPEE